MFRRILNEAFALVSRNLSAVLKIGLVWCLIITLVEFIVLQYVASISSEEQTIFSWLLAEGLVFLVNWSATASIAVAWHRFVLLHEAPQQLQMRFHSKELGYMCRELVLLAVVLTPPSILFYFTTLMSGQDGWLFLEILLAVIAAVIFVLMFWIGTRLSLVLPAYAVGLPISFKKSFEVSNGLAWPMILATICLSMVVVFVQFVPEQFLPTSDSQNLNLTHLVALCIYNALDILAAICGVAVLTVVYSIAMEGQQEASQV